MHARTNTFLVVAFLCLCIAAAVSASLTRPSRSDAVKVDNFVVSPTRDSVTWRAFGQDWQVRLSLSNTVKNSKDYFYGRLESDPSAAVSFALLPGTDLSGMIAGRNDTYWITAQPSAAPSNNMGTEALDIFMIRESSSAWRESANSMLPRKPASRHVDRVASSDNGNREKRTVTTYRVGVYMDQDWESATNNPWSSRANTLALFNDVNALYQAAGLGTFSVALYKKVINPSLTELGPMLDLFSDVLSLTLSSFRYKSYTNHVWLVGQNIGGLAYIGTSCDPLQSMKRKTAVIGLINWSRLYTVKNIAHELAHNRGANHDFDNQCTGAASMADSCQCSIMSYCFPTANNNPDGAINKFSDFSINEMHAVGCY